MAAAAVAQWSWQGLCFALPADWEVTVLEKAYLRADDAAGPRLEIVWRPRMTITEATLRARLHRLLPGAALDFAAGPSLRGLPDTHSFRFSHPSGHAGQGLALKLPDQRTAMLLLHHQRPPEGSNNASPLPCSTAAAVLGSLAIPPGGSFLPWQAFGVRLSVPASYTLQRFHFQPGHFHWQFNGPARGVLRAPEGALFFDRLGPASVLLRGKSLQEWATTFHASLPLHAQTLDPSAPCGLRWRAIKPPTPLRTLWRRLGKESWQDIVLSLWLDDADTKIMALLARGAPARNEPLLQELCARYAVSSDA